MKIDEKKRLLYIISYTFWKCKNILRLDVIFAHISIFLLAVKESGKTGQNRDNRDNNQFGGQFAQFPSK